MHKMFSAFKVLIHFRQITILHVALMSAGSFLFPYIPTSEELPAVALGGGHH